MKQFYDANSDFRRYVDHYAKKYNAGNSISIEEALEHEIVKNVAEEYKKQDIFQSEKVMGISSENGIMA